MRRLTVVYCQPVASIDGQGHLRSASCGQLQVPQIKMATYRNYAFGHAGPSIWNALSNTYQMQFTLFIYFQTSSKTFLFLAVLAHRARTRLLQLTRYINYLLTGIQS